jgi:hypothetical protein
MHSPVSAEPTLENLLEMVSGENLVLAGPVLAAPVYSPVTPGQNQPPGENPG